MSIELIAFDADDTLWHNEFLYGETADKVVQTLLSYGEPEQILEEIDETELRNLDYYGYGIKSFALSLIEAAITVSDGAVNGNEVQAIINVIREMLKAEVHFIDGVVDTVTMLAESYPLMLITKGDLFEQARKVERSGLAHEFMYIEVVSEKTPQVYRNLFRKYRIKPSEVLMVGNSLRSDVIPILEIGGQAVHIPYITTWQHEMVSEDEREKYSYYELSSITQLSKLISQINHK